MFVSDLERCHKRAGGAFTLNGGIAPFRVRITVAGSDGFVINLHKFVLIGIKSPIRVLGVIFY